MYWLEISSQIEFVRVTPCRIQRKENEPRYRLLNPPWHSIKTRRCYRKCLVRIWTSSPKQRRPWTMAPECPHLQRGKLWQNKKKKEKKEGKFLLEISWYPSYFKINVRRSYWDPSIIQGWYIHLMSHRLGLAILFNLLLNRFRPTTYVQLNIWLLHFDNGVVTKETTFYSRCIQDEKPQWSIIMGFTSQRSRSWSDLGASTDFLAK